MCDDYKYPFMKSLIDRIIQDGHSLDGGILKVDRFINHQMDPYLKIKKMNVYEEASRCLLCQDAPCTKACQTGDPARAIRAIRFDNHKPALRWVENCSDADLERAEQACIHYNWPICIKELIHSIHKEDVDDSTYPDLSIDSAEYVARTPSSWPPRLVGTKCVGCHLCRLVCPAGAIGLTKRISKKQ